jgi:hypothetical protein
VSNRTAYLRVIPVGAGRSSPVPVSRSAPRDVPPAARAQLVWPSHGHDPLVPRSGAIHEPVEATRGFTHRLHFTRMTGSRRLAWALGRSRCWPSRACLAKCSP